MGKSVRILIFAISQFFLVGCKNQNIERQSLEVEENIKKQ